MSETNLHFARRINREVCRAKGFQDASVVGPVNRDIGRLRYDEYDHHVNSEHQGGRRKCA
jgi:hypothetical protein